MSSALKRFGVGKLGSKKEPEKQEQPAAPVAGKKAAAVAPPAEPAAPVVQTESKPADTNVAPVPAVAPDAAKVTESEQTEESLKSMSKQQAEQEHQGHYTCWNCNESLSGQRYIIRDENSYCIKCYEELFANTCEACGQKIGTDSKDLSYKDKHWHERCFKCSNCDVSLVDRLFGSRNDALFCDNCYDEKFGAKCDGCGAVFKAGMKKLEWNGQQWHEECFKCTNCSTVIGCNSFMPKDNQPYCIQCFNDLFAPKCKACAQPIMTGGVLYRNEPYHRDCFGCTNCKNNLVGQKFTSRDNKPYCADCFGELFAKRCTACNKPITGIGGTKFISFDGRHWHNECFNCDGPNCGENLVGKGFITDQQEILCPNCAKLPYTKREELRQQAIQS
ncbi:four and a half LIM domains protein 2-like isoform X2 [Symsagittifera roscoffensis]|uniref:four and a half LIM domains protein 2-like isoform X2 n=1 Tax=Symsagittifera roscoffensis TaxID=84072 RepID=UPI00307C44FF